MNISKTVVVRSFFDENKQQEMTIPYYFEFNGVMSKVFDVCVISYENEIKINKKTKRIFKINTGIRKSAKRNCW